MRLLEKIKNYTKSDVCPLHMPGHKRRGLNNALPYALDITEINDFDNLQTPNGILRELLNKARDLFSSYKTFYSINGGTCGCLSSLATYCDIGDKVIVATNCHKSIYNFIELFNLKAVFVAPKYDEFGIAQSFYANDFVEIVNNNLDAKAVVLTSPTYEGVISDIKGIAQLLHSKNIPLIVDEAHGSHLFLQNKSALSCGADVVLNSCHKTLPSLTQTALIHVGNGALNKEFIAQTLQDKLNKFQSSSPSYILMASIDECVEFVKKNGDKLNVNLTKNLKNFEKQSKKLKHIKILNFNVPCNYFDFDKTKIVLFSPYLTGEQLMSQLRMMGFELEMSYNNYCLAMTTIMDDGATFEAFMSALLALDEEIDSCINAIDGDTSQNFSSNSGEEQLLKSKKSSIKNDIQKNSFNNFKKENVANFSFERFFKFTIHDATKMDGQQCNILSSVGKISKEYVYAYPPGSPILVPGEKITSDFVALFEALRKNGTKLISTSKALENDKILVLDDK